MIPLILMGVGTAMQVAGQWAANADQAAQEIQNQKFYQKQAEFARLAESRAQELAAFDYSGKLGTQVSAYAGAGVDTSGSASLTIAGTMANYINEAFAIKQKGELDFKLASSRGQLASDNASRLTSAGYNGMQAGGTLIRSAASYYASKAS